MPSLVTPRHASRLALVVLALVLAVTPAAGAATPAAAPDNTFFTDGFISAMARAGDTIYIGGSFGQVGPSTGPAVLLARSDGARNAGFPVVWGGGATVNAVAGDGSGGWWIGGDFTHVGSALRQNLAHVSGAGAVLAGAPDPDGAVKALALSADASTLYVGGSFVNLGGQPRNFIGAVGASSGALTSFDPNAGGEVDALAVAPGGGSVYAGGVFTTIGGGAHNRIAKLDAASGAQVGGWSQSVDNNAVLALAADASRVYVGGSFTSVGSIGVGSLVALDQSNGAFSWSYNATAEVDALALSGGALFAGGVFNGALSIANVDRNHVAKLSTSGGTADATWNPGADGNVSALSITGTTLYAAGAFSTFGGASHDELAAVDTLTAAVAGWKPAAPDAAVRAVAAGSSNVYAAGDFHTVGVALRNNVAAIDAATGEATAWAPDVDSEVYALATDGARVYIGGAFNNVDNVAHNYIAAVSASDGSLVSGWNPQAQSYVETMALAGGRLYIGGYFGDIDGTTMQNVAALNASDGSLVRGWSGTVVTSGFPVYSMAVSEDGSTLYLGGNFTELQLQTRFYAGAVKTADGSLLPWDPQADEPIYAILPRNGVVYLGGDIATIGGRNLPYLGAVDPVTAVATSWTPAAPDGDVHALALQGSTLFAGGVFSNVGGTARRGLAAVDTGSGALSTWNPDPNDDVLALVASPDGTVAAGGWFTSLDTGPQAKFALFSTPPSSTSAPVVSGAPEPGQTLDCSLGAWTGSTPVSYARQWRNDGVTLAGATAASYTVADTDAGHALSCSVTATNRAGRATAASSALSVPAPAGPAAAGGGGPGSGGGGGVSPLPNPVFLKTANLFPVSGKVLVKAIGSSAFVPLTRPEQLQFGAVIDATHGRVRICTSDAAGRVKCSEFFGGRFKLVQRKGKPPITELILVGGSFRGCPKPRAAQTSAGRKTRKTVVRKLWGDGSGSFRTKGRFASATIRGTTWLTADRCDGTLIRVKRGAVTVRDFRRAKSKVLKAPRKYLARAPRRR